MGSLTAQAAQTINQPAKTQRRKDNRQDIERRLGGRRDVDDLGGTKRQRGKRDGQDQIEHPAPFEVLENETANGRA